MKLFTMNLILAVTFVAPMVHAAENNQTVEKRNRADIAAVHTVVVEQEKAKTENDKYRLYQIVDPNEKNGSDNPKKWSVSPFVRKSFRKELVTPDVRARDYNPLKKDGYDRISRITTESHRPKFYGVTVKHTFGGSTR